MGANEPLLALRFFPLGADNRAYHSASDDQHAVAEKTRPASGCKVGQCGMDPRIDEPRLLRSNLRFSCPAMQCSRTVFFGQLCPPIDLREHHFRTCYSWL